MRFISTRAHGALDYLIGLFLIVLGWLWTDVPEAAAEVLLFMGALLILYSLLTDYEWGAWRVINMPMHLWLDCLGGLFLAISPWIFGFADAIFLPHLIVGILEIGAGLMTETAPSYGPTYEGGHRT